MAMPRRGQEQRRGSIQGGLEGTGKALPVSYQRRSFFRAQFRRRGCRNHARSSAPPIWAALPVSHRAVLRRKASVNLDAVPMRGVPDIVELQIVLLGPEERHRVEAL